MKFIRKLIPSLSTLLTGLATIFMHAPQDLTALMAPIVGQTVGNLMTMERSVDSVRVDVANHANRAKAYEDFGGVVATMWVEASLLMNVRPKPRGYLHGLLLLMRAQRRLEEQLAFSAVALSNVFLYGSTETQQAAIELFETMGANIIRLTNSGRQGSTEVKAAGESLALDIGDKGKLWCASAQADLAMPEPH